MKWLVFYIKFKLKRTKKKKIIIFGRENQQASEFYHVMPFRMQKWKWDIIKMANIIQRAKTK